MDSFLLEVLQDLQTLQLMTCGYLVVNSMDSDAVMEHYNDIWEEELGARLEPIKKAGLVSITSFLFLAQIAVYLYQIWRSSRGREVAVNGEEEEYGIRVRKPIAGFTATREAWQNNQSWVVLTTCFDSVTINHLILNLSTTLMTCGTIEGQFGSQTTFDLLLASAITCHVCMLWIRDKSPRGLSLPLLSMVGFLARSLTLTDAQIFEAVVEELNDYLAPIKVGYTLLRVFFAILEILVSLLSIGPYLYLMRFSGYANYDVFSHFFAYVFGYLFKEFIPASVNT